MSEQSDSRNEQSRRDAFVMAAIQGLLASGKLNKVHIANRAIWIADDAIRKLDSDDAITDVE